MQRSVWDHLIHETIRIEKINKKKKKNRKKGHETDKARQGKERKFTMRQVESDNQPTAHLCVKIKKTVRSKNFRQTSFS